MFTSRWGRRRTRSIGQIRANGSPSDSRGDLENSLRNSGQAVARHSIRATHGDSYRFLFGYDLARAQKDDVVQITERGRGFLNADQEVLRHLDEGEGMLELLSIIEKREPCRRKQILPDWTAFAAEVSTSSSPASFQTALGRRLRNILARGLVSRTGVTYELTDEGRAYLGSAAPKEEGPRQRLNQDIREFNATQRRALHEALKRMNPYLFEHLIRDLLEQMGYEDVRVTKESGDKGVDVVAKIQFGITTVTEVVQVKRCQGKIGRPVIDMLRGALPYHEALRGTIITTGGFSKGCMPAALHPGAAPITLIDGDTLLDLLHEYEVGVRKRVEVIYDLDRSRFDPTEDEEPSPIDEN